MSSIRSVCEEIIKAGKLATERPWVSQMLGGGKGKPNEYSIRKDGPDISEGHSHIGTISRHSGNAGRNADYLQKAANHADKLARAAEIMEEALEFLRDTYPPGTQTCKISSEALSQADKIMRGEE